MFGAPTFVRRPVARPRRFALNPQPLPPAKIRLRGMGQISPSPALPSCTSAVGQSVPQSVLISGGGLATLVGVIGAIFADPANKQAYAIAAGAGLAASFIGGVWAASTIAKCAADMAPTAAATAAAAVPSVPSPTVSA